MKFRDSMEASIYRVAAVLAGVVLVLAFCTEAKAHHGDRALITQAEMQQWGKVLYEERKGMSKHLWVMKVEYCYDPKKAYIHIGGTNGEYVDFEIPWRQSNAIFMSMMVGAFGKNWPKMRAEVIPLKDFCIHHKAPGEVSL